MHELEWYLFCLFSNPHFPQLQNHSFDLQNRKMSQSHTYFRPWNVVNLSRKELSAEDIRLLSKGLKFSPTPTDIDKAKLKEDLKAFKRRMRLRWHFRDNEDIFSEDNNENKFRIPSSWQPPKEDPVLENYLSRLEKEVMSVSPEGKNFSNLSHFEQLSLKQLKSHRNIVIKEADKGSAVVVWDRGDYISEANRQLDDSQVYEEVEVDPSVDLGSYH